MTYQPPQDPNQPYQQVPSQSGPGYPPPGTWQQPPAPGQYGPASNSAGPKPRRKRRVFLWVFLAIQAVFIILLVAGVAGTHTGPPHSQIVAACYNHAWWPAYNSQAQCVTHTTKTLTAQGDLGEGLGVAVEVLVWIVVDVILGGSYGIYRLATRRRRSAAA